MKKILLIFLITHTDISAGIKYECCGDPNAYRGPVVCDDTCIGKPVGISKGIIEIGGISRNQDVRATIHPVFLKTSRPCPPFCIQPIKPFAPALVDTVAELDIIQAARDVAKGDKTIMVIDTRTPVWTTAKKGGMIKGSVNIPFNKLNAKALAKDHDAVIKILTSKFGVVANDGALDFSKAKTLYILGNGLWSSESPATIRTLLKLDYPDKKLKYYRGGMNAWHSLGLGTVNNK